MIYSAWYFCNIAKLSIVETAGVLTAVQALEYAETSFAEKKKAVDRLKEYDSFIQSYMIPNLTESLFAADSRKRLNEMRESSEKRQYLYEIKDLLMKLSPERMRQSLVNLIQNLQEVDYEHVVKCAEIYEKDEKIFHEGDSQYLEIDKFFEETFLLSMLRCICCADMNMVSDLVRGEEQIELIRLALEGSFGQLCWNLAIEIQLRCGVPAYEVIRRLPRNWQERPDMVELIIPFLFPVTNGRDSLAEIMEETYRLSQFSAYWNRQSESVNGCWMNPGATKEERTRLCIVLWQGVLWNLAMNRDSTQCMELLKNCWEPPVFYKGRIDRKLHLNRQQYWMIPEGTGTNREEWTCRLVCSPWQERTENRWNKGKGKQVTTEQAEEELFHEFRGFARNDNGEKVFMAVFLLKRIFTVQDADPDDFYIRLLLHFGDLFSCYGARSTFQQVTSPPTDGIRVTAWEPPIRALGYLANNILKKIGKGLVNPFLPEKIISHIGRKSPVVSKRGKYQNEQLDYLYNAGAFLTAAYWAYESLSTTSISQDGGENAWLKNGSESGAAKLCKWIFGYLPKQARNDREVIQLDVQAFHAKYSKPENINPMWLKNAISGELKRVSFSQLILCRKLTYEEWCDVGDISRKIFGKDTYLIAHTLRIRALLESEHPAKGHTWISEWRSAVSDISYKWEFSRMARYIMVQMFAIVPRNPDNDEILVELLKKIIYMVQEFAARDSIYYVCNLSENLIGLSDRLGEETGEELRGIHAVELFRNIENLEVTSDSIYIWNDLFYYYLLAVSSGMQIASERYAGKQLMQYWESKKVHRNHLRTELVEPDEWNGCTDRIWTVKDGKLLVVRDSLNIPKNTAIGVIADSKEETDHTYQYVVYGGGEEKKFERVTKFHRIGDIVGIRFNSNRQIEKLLPIDWKPVRGEQIQARFEITGDKIEIKAMGSCFERQLKDAPELFALWNGDFSELFAHGHHLEGSAVVEYAEYSAGKWGWIPAAGRYQKFLVQKIFIPENPERKCVLTFLGETENETELLFSVRTGENYILKVEDWTQDSWERIENELLGVGNRQGIRLRVRLEDADKFPRLKLDGQDPWDYRNVRWREQFAEEQPFQIWNEGGRWLAKTDVQEIREYVVVRVRNGIERLDQHRRYNVQVTENGWEEYNQRKGYLEVEELKSHILDYTTVTYEELKKLIQIQAGDIFKLRSIRHRRQKNGYYMAELDNGMMVFCAAESFSMLSDSRDMRFWNNRLCMVENVREMKNLKEEHEGKPCNLPELQAKQGKYKGVVAEFTPVVNMDHAETLELKVFMDVDGQKVVTNVPISAFSPKPQHLGDRVETEYTGDGWIFRTQRRTINVRALWQLEDHRGQKEVQVYGASLGLTNISRIGSCMVTQDEKRPVLHLWDSDADFQNVFTMQCGVQPGNGKIRKIERRYSDRRKFHWAYQTEIVELQCGGRTFIGEARAGAFSEPSKGWKVKAEIYRVYDSQAGDWYDLRRCFIPISMNGNQKSLSAERNEERAIYFQEWIEEGDYHSSGQIKGELDNAVMIELKELYVPSAISDRATEVEWRNEIPLEKSQRPLVLGRQYATNDVRVKLKNKDGKYIASVNDVEPMLLDGKLVAHFDAVNGYTVQKKFYFAGKDDQGRLLFEWGYGYYFAADMHDVTDMDGNLIGNALFFGDRIDAFTFRYDVNGRYHWKVRTLLEDIHNEVEGRVWQDAEKGIVQLLKIKTDPKDGIVRVCEVSVTERKIRDTEGQRDGWKFRRIKNARLKCQSIQPFVPRMETGEEEIIFAYLNRRDYGKDSSCLEFLYIPIDGSDEQIEILNGKIICLTAGKITSTDTGSRSSKIENDQKIDFYLPNELPDDCRSPHLTVSVMRRNFSLDESRLRVYLQSDPRVYYGNNMLVMLKEVRGKRDRAWSGSVRDTPFRSNDNLNAWLSSGKHIVVTMGILERNGQKLKCAEISPGIICDITEFCGEMKFDDGAIASLRLADGKLQPEVVFPGDVQYVPTSGRPVELLIMDGVLKRYVQTVDMDADLARSTLMSSGGHFTIAGFPQIRLQNIELLNRMIKINPPRLGVLFRNEKGKVWVASGEKVRAGYLEISEENGMPILDMVLPIRRTYFTSWDQITFKDGTPEEIIEHVRQGAWHYHDRTTAVYNENEKRMEIKSLPDGKSYKEILVFTDGGQRLRYQRHGFEKYGMSAREIVENGLPAVDKWYPVAGITDYSLWVELFPGKIVELPKSYLITGKEKCSLSQLYTGAFAAGDEIQLSEEKVSAGERGRIFLQGFKFGARSVFGCGKVFLPVQTKGKDSVCLGGGFWKLEYPFDQKNESVFKLGLVMLDRFNKLSDVKSAEQMRTNDCVFLSLDERGRLRVAGGVTVRVEFADERFWGEMVWLLRALERDRSKVFRLFKNYLPAVIIRKNQNQYGTKIWVVCKQQRRQRIGENVTLCCNCIGMMWDSEEREQVVLRSGGYIFCVEGDKLIKGISGRIRKHVVRYLSDKRTGFFMTKENGEWKCGLNIPDYPDKMEIYMLYPIVEGNGILCRSRTNLSLHWLPISRACRVRNVETDKVWKVLSERRSRTVRLMEDGMLSLIHEQDNDRRYRLLDMQSSKERVAPKAELKRDEGYYYYLSELYPAGDLLLLKSENRQNCDQDEPVRINILLKQEDYVIVVPWGQRRYKLNLSPWIAGAYREAYICEEGNGYLDFGLFQYNIPKRFERYRDILQYAKDDAASWEAGGCTLRNCERLEDGLVYLYEMLKYAGDKNSAISKHEVYLKTYGVVREWLNEKGVFLACGFCGSGMHESGKTLDLLPTIAAILLLNRIDFFGSMLGKELAVHLACMLGYASGNSLHQEALLKYWLMEGKKEGVWKKLQRLSLGGETMEDRMKGIEPEPLAAFDGTLSERQYNNLIEVAGGIAGRYVEEEKAKRVADSLLYAAGAEWDYTEYYKYMTKQNFSCSKLAPLGRRLMPQEESGKGFPELPKQQINILKQTFNYLRQKNQPIELLTDIPIPISDKQKEWAKTTCDAVMEFLDKKSWRKRYTKDKKIMNGNSDGQPDSTNIGNR